MAAPLSLLVNECCVCDVREPQCLGRFVVIDQVTESRRRVFRPIGTEAMSLLELMYPEWCVNRQKRRVFESLYPNLQSHRWGHIFLKVIAAVTV